MAIPLVDLKAQYHSIKPEIDAAVSVCWRTRATFWARSRVL